MSHGDKAASPVRQTSTGALRTMIQSPGA